MPAEQTAITFVLANTGPWKNQEHMNLLSSTDELVSAVSFDSTGDYLAVGDKAGRICIFEADYSKKSNGSRRGAIEYKVRLDHELSATLRRANHCHTSGKLYYS